MSQAVALHPRSSTARTGAFPVLTPPASAHVAEVLPGPTSGTTTSLVAATPRRNAGALLAYVRRVAQAFRRRWQQAGTEHALHELDARTLRDIGLDRSEIGSLAAEWHGAVPATRIRAMRFSEQTLHC